MRIFLTLLLISGAWAQAHATCYDSTPCANVGLPDPTPGPWGPWDNVYQCFPDTPGQIVSSAVDPAESPNKPSTYPLGTAGKVYATNTKCGGTYKVAAPHTVGFHFVPGSKTPVLVPQTDLLGDPIPGAPMVPKPCGHYTMVTPCKQVTSNPTVQ